MTLRDSQYLTHVMERLETVGPVRVKAMFGGHGIYHKGVMFALIAHDELYFKVNAETKKAYVASGSSPFIYAGKHKPVTLSYWKLPERVLENDALLKQWMLAAVKVAVEAKDDDT